MRHRSMPAARICESSKQSAALAVAQSIPSLANARISLLGASRVGLCVVQQSRFMRAMKSKLRLVRFGLCALVDAGVKWRGQRQRAASLRRQPGGAQRR